MLIVRGTKKLRDRMKNAPVASPEDLSPAGLLVERDPMLSISYDRHIEHDDAFMAPGAVVHEFAAQVEVTRMS